LGDNVTGFVEGVMKGDVVGCAFDPGSPASLTEVICHGENGTKPFHAYHYRPATPRTGGKEGRFGFAIPLRDVAELGPVLRFTSAAGTELKNGTVTLAEIAPEDAAAPLPPADGPARPYIFLHLQKTAGMSISKSLQAELPRSAFVNIYPALPYLRLTECPALHDYERNAWRIAFGHMFFGASRLIAPEARYLTFMRDPMKRVASHYWHMRRLTPNPQVDGRPVKHSEIVNGALTFEFDNLQTRMIAGTPPGIVPLGGVTQKNVGRAMLNAEHYFDFLGLSDDVQADYDRLCNLLKLQASALPRRNEGVGIDTEDEDFKRLDWNRIKVNNRFDVALYDVLRTQRAAAA
jgi:hypothetical protein